jgi:hypothetical protein
MAEPQHETETDPQFVERIAAAIVRRRLTTPAILLLESSKPLNFIGSQMMIVAHPLLRMVFPLAAGPDYDRLVRLLEERDSIERLICAIELLETG